MSAILYKDKVYGAGGSGGGASAVSDLTDVALTDLADGQVLKWDSTEEKWVNEDESGGGGGSAEMLAPTPFIYSETEEQVGIWIDGKPIYQKAIKKDSDIPANSNVDIACGLSNISDIIELKVIGQLSSGIFFQIPFPRKSGENDNYGVFCLGYTVSTDKLRIQTGIYRNDISKIYATIYYTKTTDTAWQGGFKAYGFTPVIYSTEEREIGVYTDGKPLYQKTFLKTFDNIASNTAVSIADISGIGIDKVVNSYGEVNYYNGASWYNVNIGTYFNLYAYTNGYLQFLQTMTAQTTNRSYVVIATLQYTKTTDTAGSGKYTTLGTPSVHYDGEERVIGTWFGETLYEKTINYGALPNAANAVKDVAHNISNIKDIWIAGGFAKSTGGFFNQLNLSGVANAEWYFGVNATIIRCQAQSDRSNYSAYVTVRYTKSS